MKNVKLILEYIGTNYCGFQRQKNGVSVQEILETAIFEALGEKSTTYPSGRTDAGVHALGQVVNFFTSSNVPSDKMYILLNQKLPKDIRAVSSCDVDEKFNARKSATKKTYVYKIFQGNELSVFDQDRFLLQPKNLDIEKMNLAAKKLIGQHDFSSFVASHASTKTTVRTIYEAAFKKDGDHLIFTISGNGFLYNMVRIIVGTLLEIGKGKKDVNLLDILLQGNKRNLAGKTVSPSGLYLKEVCYN